MNIENLEKKIWYRFVKVIYIGAYLIGLFIVGLLAFTQKPQIVADADKSLIVCSNNQRYNAEEAGIYGFDLNVEKQAKSQNLQAGRIALNNSEVNQSVAEKASKVCQLSYQNEIPNYVEKTDGKNKWLEDTKTGTIISIDCEQRWNSQTNKWEWAPGEWRWDAQLNDWVAN